MAAAVVCECCGEIKAVKGTLHIRVHRCSSATEHFTKVEDYFDVCDDCYKKISALLINKEKKK